MPKNSYMSKTEKEKPIGKANKKFSAEVQKVKSRMAKKKK